MVLEKFGEWNDYVKTFCLNINNTDRQECHSKQSHILTDYVYKSFPLVTLQLQQLKKPMFHMYQLL